jgi:hypothetical protein
MAAKRVATGEAAAALGKNRRTLQRWAKRQGFPVDAAGLVDVEELRAWAQAAGLLELVQGQRQGQVDALLDDPPKGELAPAKAVAAPAFLTAGDRRAFDELAAGGGAGLEVGVIKRVEAMARARAKLAEAERKELEVLARRGDLIQVDDARRLMIGHIDAAKARLGSFPARVAARVEGLAYEARLAVLEEEVRVFLDTLASAVPGSA